MSRLLCGFRCCRIPWRTDDSDAARIGDLRLMRQVGRFSRWQCLRVRQKLDAVSHVGRVEHGGQQFEIADGLPNGDAELMSVSRA